jgi:hypothetical protein
VRQDEWVFRQAIADAAHLPPSASAPAEDAEESAEDGEAHEDGLAAFLPTLIAAPLDATLRPPAAIIASGIKRLKALLHAVSSYAQTKNTQHALTIEERFRRDFSPLSHDDVLSAELALLLAIAVAMSCGACALVRCIRNLIGNTWMRLRGALSSKSWGRVNAADDDDDGDSDDDDDELGLGAVREPKKRGVPVIAGSSGASMGWNAKARGKS